jgi:branched-chain amino acid transport system substrate-binding protein
MKRKILLGIMIAMLLITMTSCTTYNNFMASIQKDKSEDTLRIGVFEPLSGPDAAFGKLELAGIELARSVYPQILGKTVELIIEDNRADPDYAEVASNNLVKKRVSMVLGSYGSSNSMIGGVIFEKSKIPAIGITCTNPLVTSINTYYFRVCFIDTFQGITMAKYAVNTIGAKKAAIIEDNENDFSATIAQVFSDKFVSLTGDNEAIVSTTKYNEGDKNFNNQLKAIKAAGPDVIFIPGNVAEAGLIIKQAREAGINAVFLGINTWEDQKLIELAGDSANGVTFATIFDPSVILTEETQVFLSAYKTKYGKDAVPTREEALGFDAYLVAVDAITRAGSALNGELLMTTLLTTTQLPGVTGDITFDPNKDAIKPVIIKTIQNGEFVYKATIVPVWE